MNDNQTLVGAKNEFGRSLPVYDDGYGPLWISRDSMGINGIVRARTWEEAYGICEDEFFPDCDLTHEELVKEYGFKREHVRVMNEAGEFVRWDLKETPCDDYVENPCFQEAYGFRNNAGGKNPIYSKDLNGDYLDRLTPELAKELGITLEIESQEEEVA
jgi:hypothetical protein